MISTAYQKLYHVLHGKIIKEEYKPGDKLPTEKELCELYGVSRITSRHALRLLQEEGLVERFPGKGTFISGAKPKKVPIFNNDYVGSIKTGVPNAHREIVERTEKVPPGYIADHLGLFKPEKCFFAVRVDFRNNEPIAYDRTYLPLSLVSSITKEMFIRIDFLDAWLKSEGINLSHIWESVEAVTADKTAQEIFSVSKNDPMLLTTDIIYTDSGMAAGVFETFYRGDQFKLISTVNKPQRK
jgi:GntR family transcriptional regulator